MSEPANREQLAQFFHILWPAGFGERWCLFWGAPSKASQWTQAITDDFLSTLLLWGARENVYIGCGLRAQNFGPTLRGERADVVAIPGVWLDIDYGKEHKKPNLPPTEEAARALLAEMGPAPTMLLHSGRGLQAWWVFREPWILENEEERVKAERLTKGWCNTLRARAKAHGWDADQVGDLPRVMRLPGLWNLKGAKKPTTLAEVSPAMTFNPSDLDTLLLAIPQDADAVPSLTWEFSLDGQAEPPAERFLRLSEIDAQFRQSWSHTRSEFQDQSASSYDLSLATKALQAGWTAQETVNLLVAHRRKHGEDLKLRKDYYERTLNRATLGKPEEERKQRIEDLKAGAPIPEEVAKDPAECLATISSWLGVSITKFVRYRSEPNSYQIHINSKLVNVMGVEDFDSQTRCRRMILDHTDVLIQTYKPARWQQVLRYLFKAVENVDVVGGTNQMSIENWLDLYLSDGVAQEASWEAAALDYRPFYLHGHPHIVTEGFRSFLIQRMHEKITSKALAGELTKMGYEYCRKYMKTKRNTKTSRGVWRVLGTRS